jgi:16S rRNA G966 N2-methylase RsmD
MLLFQFLLLIFLVILLLGFAVPTSITTFVGAPWVPSKKRTREEMFKLAKIKKGENFYDLGSGFGSICITAAKRYGAKSVGIEIDLFKYLASRILVFIFARNHGVKIIRGNVFSQDISSADIVYCYLLPKANKKLSLKLKKELSVGTRVLTNTFKIDGFTPTKANVDAKVFLYIIK